MCRVILKAKSKCKGSSKPPWYEISAFFIACLLTYSAIASGRKGNLNVCFHDSLFHGWDDVVIGTALWEEILVYIESLKKNNSKCCISRYKVIKNYSCWAVAARPTIMSLSYKKRL